MIFKLNSELEEIKHPVGTHFQKNLPSIKMMADEFNKIKFFRGKFVNIICRGSSGAIIATVFAMHIPNENQIVHIKKPGEYSHCDDIRLNSNGINLIVDDFICSGSTMNEIYIKLTNYRTNIKIDCIAVTAQSHHKYLNFKSKYFICTKKTLK